MLGIGSVGRGAAALPRVLVAGALALVTLFACGRGADEAEVTTRHHRIEAAEWPLDAVTAKNSVFLRDRATLSGNVSVTQRATGAVLSNNAELALGFDAVLTGNAKADTFYLYDRARISGTGQYNQVTLGSEATIQGGGTSPITLPLPITLPALPSITPGTANVSLTSQQQLTQASGQYGAVTLVSGTQSTPTRLKLSRGTVPVRLADFAA